MRAGQRAGDGRRKMERGHDQDATSEPQQGEDREACTGGRALSGPVANCGKQKAYDDGEREAEHHFMRMPQRPGQNGVLQPAT